MKTDINHDSSQISKQAIQGAISNILLALRLPDDRKESGSKLLKTVIDACERYQKVDRTITGVRPSYNRIRVADIPIALAYSRLTEMISGLKEGKHSSTEIVEAIHTQFGYDIHESLVKHLERYNAGREELLPTKSAAAILATVTSRGSGPIQDAWAAYEAAKKSLDDPKADPETKKEAHAITLAFENYSREAGNRNHTDLAYLIKLLLHTLCDDPAEHRAILDAYKE